MRWGGVGIDGWSGPEGSLRSSGSNVGKHGSAVKGRWDVRWVWFGSSGFDRWAVREVWWRQARTAVNVSVVGEVFPVRQGVIRGQ